MGEVIDLILYKERKQKEQEEKKRNSCQNYISNRAKLDSLQTFLFLTDLNNQSEFFWKKSEETPDE